MPDINDINGNPAIATDQPLSIQEANQWAIDARTKANPRKATIERLKCAAAKRRERTLSNPLNALKIDPSYNVGTFNSEADAFNVESSDGGQLLGKSLSNGNVRNGQKVRSFFALNGQLVIDVKPKGRDIVIPKSEPKVPVQDPDIWPVTSCFLYSRIKNVKEKLTGNGAAQGEEETSWDAMRVYSSSSAGSYAYGFAERLDNLGDYKNFPDALNNILKFDRLIAPGGTGAGSGFARDNAVAESASQDAVTIWFYIGNPADALTNGRIVQVIGPSFHPSNGDITDGGPGYCLEVYRGGFAGSAIFPSEAMGKGPLTQYLKQSFPELGGKIGYAGRIGKWHGTQDYSTSVYTSYFRDTPSASEPNQIPTSTPSWYTPNPNVNPWNYTNASWFQFGWPSPQYIGCASTSWINIEMTALNTATSCGASIANDKWYWGGDASPSRGVLDRGNPSGFIGTKGMFVCWRGHVEHAGMAQSYFEAFGAYWGIEGGVTKLGSANFYGCQLPPELGGGYPLPPPSDARRFLVEAYGRKAKVILACQKQDYGLIEIELPFEYAAVVEELTVLGGGSFGLGTGFESGKTRKQFRTYGEAVGVGDLDPYSLDLLHGTLSIDAEFAYVNLFYGGERLYEEPKTLPVPTRLAAQGFGSPRTGSGSNYGNDYLHGRRLGLSPQTYEGHYPINWPQTPEQTGEKYARFVKDCWTRCLAIKVKLPTKDDKTLTIVATQKYKRGEEITLTANNPDNEFDKKFLIRDYRTDGLNLGFVSPKSDYASFGGLPALAQQVFIDSDYSNSKIPLDGIFYKEKKDFTVMDWVHYQLQEMPRQYNPLITILPPGVSIELNGTNKTNMIYDLDRKFGGHARAEKIMTASSFGYSGTYYGGSSPTYSSQGGVGPELLFISHKEQMIGNGLKVNGILKKWFRVTPGSFPVLGQLLRNNS